MHLNLDLSPQVSDRLTAVARSRGVDPAALIASLVTEYLPRLDTATVKVPMVTAFERPIYRTPQERIQAMDAIAERNADLPILSDSAFDREYIYEDKL